MTEQSFPRILLLDDEPFMLKLIGRQLASFGVTSLTSHTNGSAALAALDATTEETEAFDLILLDLNMPEMDGIEFVRHLVDRHYAGSLVLISGEDERILQSVSTLIQAHKIQMLGHLQKPVGSRELEDVVMRWRTVGPLQARKTRIEYDADSLGVAIANGDLVNHYQPKVTVADSRVVGVETLVRWQHPVDGLVYPDQFISVAETHGLIDDLTRVVLLQALRDARVWHDAGLTLKVAVNLSMNNLAAPSFADFVVSATAQAGLRPSDIVLEVTESRLMEDLRAPLEVLTRLRMKRFRLSIDDFGTGHSSLAQLRDFPFDELKIDRSFTHNAHSDGTLRAIFVGNVGMARQLGMEVVAEGVEDQDDWNFLRGAHCDLAQGYFIAKPMPAAALIDWINDWQRRGRDDLQFGFEASA